MEDVLASKGKQKTELISQMLEDEKYQREAFQALLLKEDHRALEISEQMSRIQNELAALTVVEMKKRDMKVEIICRTSLIISPKTLLFFLKTHIPSDLSLCQNVSLGCLRFCLKPILLLSAHHQIKTFLLRLSLR